MLLYHGTFYGFSTDGGFREWTAPEAGGPWTTLAEVLVHSSAGVGRYLEGDLGPAHEPDDVRDLRGVLLGGAEGNSGNPPGQRRQARRRCPVHRHRNQPEPDGAVQRRAAAAGLLRPSTARPTP